MSPERNIYVLGTHALSKSYQKKLLEGQGQKLVLAKDIICVENPAEFILRHFEEKKPEVDIMIPDHTAKHVMLQVFMNLANKSGVTELTPIQSDVSAPFLHKSDNDAIWAMSFATWSCPPDCTEPAICPHIQNTRTWEMGQNMQQICNTPLSPWGEGQGEGKRTGVSSHIFPCELIYKEIAGISFDLIHAELNCFKEKLRGPLPLTITVATHSHCHGIVGRFVVE